MPNVSATPRQMGNGDVITQFFDSIGTAADTYTYPKTQEKLVIRNMGPASLSVTVAGVTQVIPKHDKWEKVVDFTSFSINAVTGVSAFDAWADEKGSTFDTPEGQYFQSNGGGGGGSGVLIYADLNALQTALPNGSSSPVWVASENTWYYWSSEEDTTAPTVSVSPASGTYAGTQSITLSANEPATIYYTTNGSTPTESSSVYSSPISVSVTGVVKYFGKDTAGNSSSVQTASYTITVPDTTPPGPATGFTAGTPTSSTVPTSWTAPGDSDLSKYELAYSTDGTNFTVANANVTGLAYTFTGLSASTLYTLRVVAIDTSNNRSTAVTTTATTAVPSPVSITDSFTGDGDLNGRTTETGGKTWVSVTGSWSTSGGQAVPPNLPLALAWIDSGMSDATIQVTLSTLTLTNTRVVFRGVDAANNFIVNTNTGTYVIFKQVAGAFTSIGTSTGVTPTNGDVIKLVLNGTSIDFYVNGVQRIPTITATEFQTATKHGITSHSQPTARFDNFSVTSL